MSATLADAVRDDLVRSAASFRHGIVLPPQPVKRTLADPPEIVNIAVPESSGDPWKSVSGGVARTLRDAELAAVGEALERYAARMVALPKRRLADLVGRPVLRPEDFSLYSEEQRRRPDFPHRELYDGDLEYANVFALADNEEA